MKWNYSFRLRSVDASGVPTKTYIPGSNEYVDIEISPEYVQLERTDINYTKRNVNKGYYRHYDVTLTATLGAFTGTTDSLEDVISDSMNAGHSLQLSTSSGFITWVSVQIEDDTGPNKAGGKNNAIVREFDFSTTSLLTIDSPPEDLD